MELKERLEAEDACVWGAWAGALVVAVAACVAGEELAAVLRQPSRTGRPDRIVLQRGHVVGIGGGSIPQLIRLAGAEPEEVGAVDGCAPELLAAALGGEAAAGLFVQAAGTAQGLLAMPAFVWACRAAGKPAVVALWGGGETIAALDAGADLVVLDGEAAGLAGRGVIAGGADLVRACRLQARGIGRAFLSPDPHPGSRR